MAKMRIEIERSVQSHDQKIIFVINDYTLTEYQASRFASESSGCPVWDAICLLADLYNYEKGLLPPTSTKVQKIQVKVFDPPQLLSAQ